MSNRNQHVIPHDGKWALKSERSKRVSSVFPTKREAIDAAREIARKEGGVLFVHGPTGQIFQHVVELDPVNDDEIREAVRKAAVTPARKSSGKTRRYIKPKRDV